MSQKIPIQIDSLTLTCFHLKKRVARRKKKQDWPNEPDRFQIECHKSKVNYMTKVNYFPFTGFCVRTVYMAVYTFTRPIAVLFGSLSFFFTVSRRCQRGAINLSLSFGRNEAALKANRLVFWAPFRKTNGI